MHRHHDFLHFHLNRELDELYVGMGLRSFALSMIGVFLPIYLLKSGFSFQEVFMFFLVLNAVHFVFVVPSAKLASRIGFKHMILLSTPLLVLSYIMLLLGIGFYYVAALIGIQAAFFWTSYHVDFARFSKKGSRGRQIGLSHIVNTLFSVAGPFIGGVLLVLFNFDIVFIFASLILLLSAVPFLLSKDIHYKTKFSIKNIFRKDRHKSILGFFGYGFETGVAGVLWPVYIFVFILNSFTLLGSVASMSLLFSMIFTIVIEKYSDVNRKLLLKAGSIINSIVWTVRTLVSTTFHVFLIDSFAGASRILIEIPIATASYDRAASDGIVEYIIFRELIIIFGRIVLFAGMFFVSDFIVGFLASGAASLLIMLI